jgi:hypothetical protein
MQRPAKPCTSVRFRVPPPLSAQADGPGGEIGRHSGLKIRRLPERGRTGSIPVPGTMPTDSFIIGTLGSVAERLNAPVLKTGNVLRRS